MLTNASHGHDTWLSLVWNFNFLQWVCHSQDLCKFLRTKQFDLKIVSCLIEFFPINFISQDIFASIEKRSNDKFVLLKIVFRFIFIKGEKKFESNFCRTWFLFLSPMQLLEKKRFSWFLLEISRMKNYRRTFELCATREIVMAR